MKNLTLIFVLISSLTFSNSFGQTAIGGCNSVTLTSVPSYQFDLVIAGGWSCQACNGGQCFDVLATSPPQFATTRSWLQKKQSNGTFTTVQGGANGIHGDNVSFTVTESGIYRIFNQRPNRLLTTSCPNGRIVKNINLTDTQLWLADSIRYFNI